MNPKTVIKGKIHYVGVNDRNKHLFEMWIRDRGKADAGNIAVCIYRHVYLAGHFRLDVEGVYGHFGIYFSRFRIFVSCLLYTSTSFENSNFRS